MTPSILIARRLALVWGVHALPFRNAHDVGEMIELACEAALTEGFAKQGDTVVIAAGLPFGKSGTANLLHIAKLDGSGLSPI
jgi:pyruvate kinase